jgi:RNA polymerase sigma-70 factor (ECF subfamily)
VGHEDLKRLAERTLILRCQLGDESAFERLVRKYHRRLRYFVRQLAGSTDAAEDVLQEVWVTVYRKIATLRQPDAFVAWLYGIARHKVYHAIRRPAYVELAEDCDIPAYEDEDSLLDRYDAVQIHAALSLLQPEHREVLILRFFDAMPYSDIAEAVGCRIGTVKSRLNIAKKRLREHLERTDFHER